MALALDDFGLQKLADLDETATVALHALGDAHDAKQWAKCVEVGDAWIEARGELPILACVFYAQALMGIGRYPEALQWASKGARHMPKGEAIGYVAALSTYAQALCRVGAFTLARRTIKHMLVSKVDHPEAVEKQGHMWLSVTDKWRDGWKMLEARYDHSKTMPAHTRRWDGVTKEPVAVLHEQGIGDAILLARWMPWLAEYTGHPVKWFGPALLRRWMAELPGVLIGTEEDEKAAADSGTPIAAVYAMSLPHVAQCHRPSQVPLPIAPERMLEIREHLSMARGFMPFIRIGVCWKGASHGWHDFERSLTYEDFAPVMAPIEGVTFVNLCHDADVPEGAPFERAMFGDIYETAEAIAQCDLVISVDTSIVHLAGSIGVPTLVITPTVPDWRYQWPRGSSTPFYQSVTVSRRKHGSDLSVVDKARTMAERFARSLQRKTA